MLNKIIFFFLKEKEKVFSPETKFTELSWKYKQSEVIVVSLKLYIFRKSILKKFKISKTLHPLF